MAKDFEQNHWTKFTPHYVVWTCPSSYHSSAECKSQCTHSGRYCTPDPDGDIKAGYSGADIVTENLRQLCVFRLANESGKPWVWWDYVTRFGEQCTMAAKKYDETCAEKVWRALPCLWRRLPLPCPPTTCSGAPALTLTVLHYGANARNGLGCTHGAVPSHQRNLPK